jgi:hypothetical protein
MIIAQRQSFAKKMHLLTGGADLQWKEGDGHMGEFVSIAIVFSLLASWVILLFYDEAIAELLCGRRAQSNPDSGSPRPICASHHTLEHRPLDHLRKEA